MKYWVTCSWHTNRETSTEVYMHSWIFLAFNIGQKSSLLILLQYYNGSENGFAQIAQTEN